MRHCLPTADLVLVLICLLLPYADFLNSFQLQGRAPSCEQEGAPQSIAIVTSGRIPEHPCIHCMCRNGEVVCLREECQDLGRCPVVVRDAGVACCPRCLSCPYAGQIYANDDHWQSSQDACRTLSCKGGVTTVARMNCLSLCRNPERRTGFCCPLCPEEELGKEARSRCVRCHCQSGWCHCYRTACPVLDCAPEAQYRPPNACCPECRSFRHDMTLRSGRCFFRHKSYAHEQSFRPDPCTWCKCQDGWLMCKRFVCPVLNCEKERQIYHPLLCCPRCQNEEPLACSVRDPVAGVMDVRKHGDTWSLDLCTRCKCSNGVTKCETERCPHPHGCPQGYRQRKLLGKCCSVCEEKDATCTVFGDPQYQTFDGRLFSFQGTCSYVLTKQCIYGSDKKKAPFVVVVQNALGQKKKSITKHVTIRLQEEDLRISLLQGQRLKQNGRKMRLPHVKLGVYSAIVGKDGNLVVRLNNIGLKVLWDGVSFVEVSVSAALKGRLCGLCGNYNHDVADDLVTDEGLPTQSVDLFAQSWRFGSVKRCRAAKDRKYQERLAARRRKERRREKKWKGAMGWFMLRGRKAWNGEDLGPSSRFPPFSPAIPKTSKRPRRRQRLRRLCPGGRKTWRKRRKSIANCRLLRSKLFASCHDNVPVVAFFRRCVEDACACPETGRCYCESLENYAERCRQIGMDVDWRRKSDCVSREACTAPGSLFLPCAPTCEPTCTRQCPTESTPESSCLPSCRCPSGSVLHLNQCIPNSQCPSKALSLSFNLFKQLDSI